MVYGNSSGKSSTKPAKRPYTRKTQKVVIEKKVPVPFMPKKKKLQKANAAMTLWQKKEHIEK